MREFESGAKRDDLGDKLSYMKALSPAVLRCYAQYLGKHRKQSDGKLRDWDNWKKGISPDVYCDSLLRHSFDAWLLQLGHSPTDESYDLRDLLCAVIFNASGWLYELLCNEDREGTAPPKHIEPMLGDTEPGYMKCLSGAKCTPSDRKICRRLHDNTMEGRDHGD